MVYLRYQVVNRTFEPFTNSSKLGYFTDPSILDPAKRQENQSMKVNLCVPSIKRTDLAVEELGLASETFFWGRCPTASLHLKMDGWNTSFLSF